MKDIKPLAFFFLVTTAFFSWKTITIYFPNKKEKSAGNIEKLSKVTAIKERHDQVTSKAKGHDFSKTGISKDEITFFDRVNEVDLKWLKENIKNIKDINKKNSYGTTALAIAVGSDSVEVVELLLKHGANPNIKFNKRNYTLLMDCALNGKVDILSLLIKAKINLNTQDKEGKTALIYASDQGNAEVVKKLIHAGADKSLKDIKGLNAKDYARMRSFKDILILL